MEKEGQLVPLLTTKAASRGEGSLEEPGGGPRTTLTEQLPRGAHSEQPIWFSNSP